MDYDKLLEPYYENGRTTEGQVRWLQKKGFPDHIIEEAMSGLYLELDRGKHFVNGHALDRELLAKAEELKKFERRLLVDRSRERLIELEEHVAMQNQPYVDEQEPRGFWSRLWQKLNEPI